MQAKQFWTRTYKQNIEKMIGVCYRYVGDRALAEDLAHEAFLTAIEKSRDYRKLGSFEGWLMKINLNTALQYLRKKRGFLPVEEMDIQDKTNEEPLPGRDFTRQEILDAVCRLPDHNRAVFNLYVFENQSHNQIAKTLNIGERSSKRYLSEARTQLQQMLNKVARDKKSRIMILLPLIHKRAHAVDTICRQHLRNLSFAPTTASPLAGIDWAGMPAPNGWIQLSNASVPVSAGVATCAIGSAVVWQVAQQEPQAPTHDPAPNPAETVIDSADVPTEDTIAFVAPNQPTTETSAVPMDSFETTMHIETAPIVKETPTPPVRTPDYLNWGKITRNGFVGLKDEKGRIVIYPKYSDIGPFDEYRKGWALVNTFGFLGFIDSTGKEVVTPQYDEIGPFDAKREGLAYVRKGKYYGYLNTNGKEVEPVAVPVNNKFNNR